MQNAIYSFSVFFITVAVFSVAVFAANREYVGIAISGEASAYSVGRSFCDVEEKNDIIRRLKVFNRPKFSGRHDFQAEKFGRQCTKSRSHAVGLQENSNKNLIAKQGCASKKNILNIFDCNLKKDYRILIILVTVFLKQLAIKSFVFYATFSVSRRFCRVNDVTSELEKSRLKDKIKFYLHY